MRRKLLVGNWKMNKTPDEAIAFASEIQKEAKFAADQKIDLGIAPTFLCLNDFRKNAPNNILVFAQNVHYEDHGAFTGEVSATMLKSIRIDGSIIGHSERRTYDNETSKKCAKKIRALLKENLIPLYCVGETEQEFNEGKTKEVILKQLKEGLEDFKKEEMKKIIIAYEPVWSIGTGKNASEEIAENVCKFIREEVEKMIPESSKEVRILYGGSVKPNNIAGYLKQENVDGALVGGASLTPSSFAEMIHALSE